MGIQTHKKTIDGREYSVTTFPAMYSLRLKTSLTRTFGPAIVAALSQKGASLKDVMDGDLADLNLEHAVQLLTEKLTEDTTEDLVNRLLSQTVVGNRSVTDADVFNDCFAGNLTALYRLIGFVIEVNYGGFMKAVGQAPGGTGSQPDKDREPAAKESQG